MNFTAILLSPIKLDGVSRSSATATFSTLRAAEEMIRSSYPKSHPFYYSESTGATLKGDVLHVYYNELGIVGLVIWNKLKDQKVND